MNVSPYVYSKSKVSQEDNEYINDTYLHRVQWRKGGNDTVLDIGSGPGDVTVEVLLPKIPKSIKYLVGADIAQDMVDYANKHYSSSKISFEQWNMAREYEVLLGKYPDGFDHIFSVYAFHWHPDQQRIIQNVYKLLSPTGDCLLAILGRHDFYDIYLELSKNPKWGELMQDNSHITIPFQYKENREKIYYMNAINPFLKRLSNDEKNEYFRDYVAVLLKLGLGEMIDDGNSCKFIANYEFMIVNARK